MDSEPVDWDEVHAKTASHVGEFIGLDTDEARALALKLKLNLRIVTPDTDFITADMQVTRITIYVDDAGRVSDAGAY